MKSLLLSTVLFFAACETEPADAKAQKTQGQARQSRPQFSDPTHNPDPEMPVRMRPAQKPAYSEPMPTFEAKEEGENNYENSHL